jgi:hypothetical protein
VVGVARTGQRTEGVGVVSAALGLGGDGFLHPSIPTPRWAAVWQAGHRPRLDREAWEALAVLVGGRHRELVLIPVVVPHT